MKSHFSPIMLFLLLTIFSRVKGQDVQAIPTEERKIAICLLNLEENKPNYGLDWMRHFRNSGGNAVVLTVRWDMVYWDKNTPANWSLFDKQIALASELGMKIGIRIHVGRHFARTEGFWTREDDIWDFWGRPCKYYYENSHFSFVSENGVRSAKSFVQEVCQRYKPYLEKGDIHFVNVSNTPDQEAGFYYQNKEPDKDPEEKYQAVYDHSDFSMEDLQARMTDKYQTVNTLNKYWGTTFIEWKQVVPYVNRYNVNACFAGKRGKDWYAVRTMQLKSYLEKMGSAIKEVDARYRVLYDFGSMTDKVSLLRGTYCATTISENADIIKHNDEVPEWSFDILGYNTNKPIYDEVFLDKYQISDVANVADWYFTRGSSYVALVVANDEHSRKAGEVLSRINHWKTKEITPITADRKMDIYASQLIDNYDLILTKWREISENGTKRVHVNLIEDILKPESISYEPYKTPEELEYEYGLKPPPPPTGGGTPPPPPPVVTPPPPLDTTAKDNKLPFVARKFTPQDLIIGKSFWTWLDNDIFRDEDGYIATIEMVSGPEWLTFNRADFSFSGMPKKLGDHKVVLKAYDNHGATVVDSFNFHVVLPAIKFKVIDVDYFDVPIRVLRTLSEADTLYRDELPLQINILSECNVDSIRMEYELTGPFYRKSEVKSAPFTVFGNGRGFTPPLGRYVLKAQALKGDSLITSAQINFVVKKNREKEEPIADWTYYPNPFMEVVNVKIPDTVATENLTFELIDVAGRKYPIAAKQLTTFQQTVYVDLRPFTLQFGTYFLQISEAGKQVSSGRIIKR